MKKLFLFIVAAMLFAGTEVSAALCSPLVPMSMEKSKDPATLTLEELIELLATTETGRTRSALPFECGISTEGELCFVSHVAISGVQISVYTEDGILTDIQSANFSSAGYIGLSLEDYDSGNYIIEVVLPDGILLSGIFSL